MANVAIVTLPDRGCQRPGGIFTSDDDDSNELVYPGNAQRTRFMPDTLHVFVTPSEARHILLLTSDLSSRLINYQHSSHLGP